MMNKSEIFDELRSLGYGESELDRVFNDVGRVILGTALEKSFRALPQSESERISKMQADEILTYLNNPNLPGYSTQEFSDMHDAIWRDYFDSMRKRT